jgi:pimeloyl-ACP methyl ester carboxylesterase
LFIKPELFRAQFAADVAEERAGLDAATQRPLNTDALNGRASEPAWKTLPSFFVFSSGDRNIPVAALRFMAERADAVETVEIPDASHALPVSQPEQVAAIILSAVESVRKTGA